jgi:hypothetical protein
MSLLLLLLAALLLRFNHYHGHFRDGQRSGYGVMHYATGARHEGQWLADKKQGLGCFVFENGDIWQGAFDEDRPVVVVAAPAAATDAGPDSSSDPASSPSPPPPPPSEHKFAPQNVGVTIQISDLLDQEESPPAAARGVKKVLMVFNSDLRALYDKYCRRPSLHLPDHHVGSGHVLLSSHFWELVGDARLASSALPLGRAASLLVKARAPPPALRKFRDQVRCQGRGEHDNMMGRQAGRQTGWDG